MSAWDPRDPRVVAWIEQAVGSGARVVSVEEMPTSATAKHAITVESRRSIVELILRRYHDPDRLGIDPWYDPGNEVKALELLAESVVPAPLLVAADLGAEICDVPALLETRVPGEQAWQPDDLDAYLTGAAEVLVQLHAFAPDGLLELPPYRPYFSDDPPPHPPAPTCSAHRRMWERAVAVAQSVWPATPIRFIHRDYHPGNALWDGAGVHGVVDWATAARGPAGIDLGRMRQNLAGWHGTAVADAFTVRYVEAGGDPAGRDPFWDLVDAVDSVAYMDEPEAPGDGNVDLFEDYVAAVCAELR